MILALYSGVPLIQEFHFGCSFVLLPQDLLQLQYEGLAIMKMFGRAKINVNLLIYLINKKFYGRVL